MARNMNETIWAGIVHLKKKRKKSSRWDCRHGRPRCFQAVARFPLSETDFHTANRLQCCWGYRFAQLTWVRWVCSKHTGEVVEDEKVFLSSCLWLHLKIKLTKTLYQEKCTHVCVSFMRCGSFHKEKKTGRNRWPWALLGWVTWE